MLKIELPGDTLPNADGYAKLEKTLDKIEEQLGYRPKFTEHDCYDPQSGWRWIGHFTLKIDTGNLAKDILHYNTIAKIVGLTETEIINEINSLNISQFLDQGTKTIKVSVQMDNQITEYTIEKLSEETTKKIFTEIDTILTNLQQPAKIQNSFIKKE